MTAGQDPAGAGERSQDSQRSAAASVAALRDAIAAGPAAGQTRRGSVRTAARAGRPVVVLRLVEDDPGGGTAAAVECDVYPLNSLRVEPLRPGPYRFPTTDGARDFIEEAMLTLRYLGCDVTS